MSMNIVKQMEWTFPQFMSNYRGNQLSRGLVWVH